MNVRKLWLTATVAAVGAGLGYVAIDGAKTAPAYAADAQPSALRADNFRLTSHDMESYALYPMADAKAVVIMAQGNGDQAVQSLAPTLKQLRAQFKDKGVEFLMLNSNRGDTREAIVAEAEKVGYGLPILLDENQLVGEQLGMTRNGEVVVINPKTWQIAYRGPLSGRQPFTAKAIEALIAGQPVETPKQAFTAGKAIDFPERGKAAAHAKISYSQTIAPLIRDKCVDCHQAGGIGPMALSNYEQIKGFAPMIRETIRTKRMPPFHADTHVTKYSDGNPLTGEQIKTLIHWIEAGAPRGAGADPLASAKFQAPEWPLGKPDLIIDIPDQVIPASGVVEYQRPFAINPLTEGRWVRATTYKVGQRQGVHHFLSGHMEKAPALGQPARESDWGASLGTYAVGTESTILPTDMGIFMPAGGAIGFQGHYTPFGKAVTDKSQLGVYFYDKAKKPKMMMRQRVIIDPTISIPPNTERHKEMAYMVFEKDAIMYGAFLHAHYRGAGSQLDVIYPDGKRKVLISVPKYDFNWQRDYTFAEPVRIPAGSKLVAINTFDNSKRNPANPDPNRVVPWGDQSWDEMLYTAMRFRWVDETTDNLTMGPERPTNSMSIDAIGLMDDNIDGKIQLTELKGSIGAPMKAIFPTFDKNKDGALDKAEMAAVMPMLSRAFEPH